MGHLQICGREDPSHPAGSSSLTTDPSKSTCGHFDTVVESGTHNVGGAIMGADPSTSVVNTYSQMWDFQNVWVLGGSSFPQNGTPNPTETICALALRATDGITSRYLKRSQLLV